MRSRALVELFTRGCPSCGGWLAYGQGLAPSSLGYELRVWDAREERSTLEREERMRRYGIKELPAIVIDGELLECCLQDGDEE